MMLLIAWFLVVTADFIRQAEARVVDARRARVRACPARSMRAHAWTNRDENSTRVAAIIYDI